MKNVQKKNDTIRSSKIPAGLFPQQPPLIFDYKLLLYLLKNNIFNFILIPSTGLVHLYNKMDIIIPSPIGLKMHCA